MTRRPRTSTIPAAGTRWPVLAASRRVLVLESLRYWVKEMHVDGFRFDLASVLARNPDGSFASTDDSLLTAIRTDPILRDVRLIAEPWDAGWAYQLGTEFPGALWHQWNGRFRDDVRRFVRGDPGMVGALMLRLYGSDDLFPDNPRDARRPYQSINYVTCHDGFTLYDVRRTQREAQLGQRPRQLATGRRTTSAGTAAGRETRECPPRS